MASRYWVGGTGTWDATNTANWAAVNGGPGGQSVPTSADTVFINANSGTSGLGTVTLATGYNPVVLTMSWSGWNGTVAFGSQNISLAGTGAVFTADSGDTPGYTVTGTPVINFTNSTASSRSITARVPNEANSISLNITAGTGIVVFTGTNVAVKNLDFTGFSGSFTCGTNHILYGNLTFSSEMTVGAGGTSADGFTFSATSGTQTITSNGQVLSCQITVDGIGGTVQLADNFTVTTTALRDNPFTLTNGTFDANGKNVSVGTFTSNNSNTRTLTMGSGTWTISGVGSASAPIWEVATATLAGLTFNANTANIVLSDTSTTTRYFSGGPLSYNKLTIGGTTGTSTTVIVGEPNQYFSEIASTKTVAHTITFGGTASFGNWTASGTGPGKVLTVNCSSPGVSITLPYRGSSKISLDYMSITDIEITQNTLGPSNPYLFYAGANSTNGGNNLGIVFISGQSTAYLLTSGTTWTVPADWNSINNVIYMIGAGGGGASGAASGTARAAGGGGGGGGYRVVNNQSLTPGASVPYTIGTSTAGANGGDTTFNTTNIAGGGGAGTATTAPTSAGGAGGTGTYSGGAGGAGAFATATATTGYGSGGGGGSGGPRGVGGGGGSGISSATATNISGGGGGGNGGGSNGTIGTASLGGNGGNNANGTGGAVGGATTGASGTVGGGGAGGNGNLGTGGNGGSGYDILGVIGGSGGKGGHSTASANPSNAGLYGGGGSGGFVATTGVAYAGSAGSQGVILVVYTPGYVAIGPGVSMGAGLIIG